MKQAWKKKTRAPSIRRPPRARDPQENHRRDNRGPHPEKGRGEPEGRTPDSHSIDTQGAVMASPQAPPAADHTRADQPLGPEIQGPPTPQPGPSKASRARPRQATAESGPALARASCPGARNHQRTGGILQRQGMMVGWGSTEMMNTQKWTQYPHSHPPYALYTPRSKHHRPQRGDQRPIPELNPLRSAVEKTTSPDPDQAASSSSQPPAPDREQRAGV
ncbi:unnamed protein product [Leuciscus chuanchicus]